MSLRPIAQSTQRVIVCCACFLATGLASVEAAGVVRPKAELAVTGITANATGCRVIIDQTQMKPRETATACAITATHSMLDLSELASSDFGDTEDTQN